MALAVGLVAAIGAAAQAEDRPAAMRIYRDPHSGVIGAPPPGAAAPAAALRVEADEDDDLREEPVTVPAGGMQLRLRGRYPSAIQRQVGAAGPRAHECTGPVGATDE